MDDLNLNQADVAQFAAAAGGQETEMGIIISEIGIIISEGR